jgi:uncharacterized protein YcnI
MAMSRAGYLAGLALVLVASGASAHVTVWPQQSALGAREKYVIRTPNERQAPTVKIEAAFPAEVKVTHFEAKDGWRIEPKRNAGGAIVGASWTGSLPVDQFVEFAIMAQNPAAGSSLTWNFTQTYADGTIIEWTGPAGSRTPAPMVALQPATATAHQH